MAGTGIAMLSLGDSYTIGEGVAEHERWPQQLAAALRDEGIPVAPPRIVAQTGWSTDELDAAIDAAGITGSYGLVTLLIGVNNQYRGRDVDDYRAQFDGLLQRAIGFAGGRADRVLALSIPDWGVTPFAAASGRDTRHIARDIDAYNATAGQCCKARDVAWVDVTFATRNPEASRMLVADGLHPSPAMYAQWTALALPEARRLLTA
ncbi:SGNH/GDSL hydrolase family protein [Luteimonas yindakuii]|uniref:SGNH/GDSL hydrolase family protein n=1 Tax=Luteimonas yindakuii TaxID=2565782 RepID=A0A4Z1R8P7_9GAMM|nr:SGNH/GDSL hydrolase family protein [Luteimonas yindakuii]QCO68533.1 SGNH/GDSL hydrolase family protein [Luteimonas yindakuii]TKS54975.1 SGNH/GDSL hydrolase family protein [Luteimonas yindakuii]